LNDTSLGTGWTLSLGEHYIDLLHVGAKFFLSRIWHGVGFSIALDFSGHFAGIYIALVRRFSLLLSSLD
jgi:hypothetical protein